MRHPLVTQLRFARAEFQRCLEGVSQEDGVRRLGRMNSIGWIVGHMACQEQYFWLVTAQGRVIRPELYELAGFGQPATTPPLNEMWTAWRDITAEADVYLHTLTDTDLDHHLELNGEPARESVGHWLLRNIYHYWFHTGEGHAIRQSMGHGDLPQFVGRIAETEYRIRDASE